MLDPNNISPLEQQRLQTMMGNYKLTPMTLGMKLNPRLIPSKFQALVSAKVAHTIAKGNGRLIISAPPRHGKSELITKNTPIWTLENFGQKNVILCTYGAQLSTDFGRKIRDIVQNNTHLLDMRIRQDAHRVDNWLTDKGGAMMSVGVGGPITGRGADVLLIDDYIKEIKEALSQNHRDYLWEWFQTTAFTRIEPGGSCIIIATRWHDDDLIGRILKHNPGGNWEQLIIPAIAEPPGYNAKDPATHHFVDILGRKYGEALFPERYDTKALLERKQVLGTFFFNAMFQQRPENEDAKLTDKSWLKYFSSLAELQNFSRLKFTRCWDLAATEDGGDWTVGVLCAYDEVTDDFYVLNVKRFQASPGGVERLVRQTALEDGPAVTVGIEQEPGSSGKALVHAYRERVLHGFQVYANPTHNNKVLRAQPWLANVEAGKTHLLTAGWNQPFVDEYDAFPGGEHDDQIDPTAAAYVHMSGKKRLSIAWGRDADANDTLVPGTEKRLGPDPNDWRNQGQFAPGNNPLGIEGEILPPIKQGSSLTFGRSYRPFRGY
jgi:predicted phage terminase large subunit-like protein